MTQGREEACATVTSARLLGYCRSGCIGGPEAGRVIVRSLWRAEVTLEPWTPEFETTHRRLVAADDLLDHLAVTDSQARTSLVRLWKRAWHSPTSYHTHPGSSS